MAKKTIEEVSQTLQTVDVRVSSIEANTRKEQIEAIASDVFRREMKHEDFRNKVKNHFSDFLKNEEFLNKVASIASKKAQEYVQSKIMWNIGLWLLIAIASILLQRFTHVVP
jgi:hypothetical protein